MNNETLTQVEKELLHRENLEKLKHSTNNDKYQPLYDNNGYCHKFN